MKLKALNYVEVDKRMLEAITEPKFTRALFDVFEQLWNIRGGGFKPTSPQLSMSGSILFSLRDLIEPPMLDQFQSTLESVLNDVEKMGK